MSDQVTDQNNSADIAKVSSVEIEPGESTKEVSSTSTPPAVEAVPVNAEVPDKNEQNLSDTTSSTSADDKSTSVASDSQEADSLQTEQVVVFKLENEEYASHILEVQEIIPTGDITPFPNVPDYIAGIINVRGTVATVLNLSKRFKLTRKEGNGVDRYIILTKTDKALFGIMVDEVTSVMKIPVNKIKPASSFGDSKIHTDYIKGVAVVGERIILILEFSKILDEATIKETAMQVQEAK